MFFFNCLCHYATFCSWCSFFVCTYGDTVKRNTNMLHVAIFTQWFNIIYIYTLDILLHLLFEGLWIFGPYKYNQTKTSGGGWMKTWGSEGPFDVILGFSEGASCAAVLLAAIQGVWEARIWNKEITQQKNTQPLPLACVHLGLCDLCCVIWWAWNILFGIHGFNCAAWKNHNVFRMKTKWLRSHWL